MVQLFERIIELAPEHPTAYLNLANQLRREFCPLNNWQAVLKKRQKIGRYYRQYLALGGEKTPEIEKYLQFYPAQENTKEICQAIANDANEVNDANDANAQDLCQLTETGKNLFDVNIHGKRIHIQIGIQGSAKLPLVELTDDLTGLIIQDSSLIEGYRDSSSEYYACIGVKLSLVMYQDDIHFLLSSSLGLPIKSSALFSDNLCLFTTETLETIGQNAADPQVCSELQQGAEIGLYQYDQPAPQTIVEKIWDKVYGTTSEMNFYYTKIDVNNNEQPLNIVQIPVSHQAGSGCNGTYYIALDDSLLNSETTDALLNEMQDSRSVLEQGGIPMDCGNTARFFLYKGRVYFEDTNNYESQYHKLKRIDNGRVVDVCDYQLSNKTQHQREEPKEPKTIFVH